VRHYGLLGRLWPPIGGIPPPPATQVWRIRSSTATPLPVELGFLLALTAVVSFVFGRGLHAGAVFDEGVYMASLDALEHGQRLGSQVFASQPPGFYTLLEMERAIFGSSLVDIRIAMLLLSLVGCLSAYYIGRSAAGP